MNKKMMMLAVFLAVAFAVYSIYQQMQPGKDIISNGLIVLYFGYSCPHCLIIEDFLKENNISKKISFSQKEVFKNKNNYQELSEKAKLCNIPENEIGVPFLWDGEKCFVGDKDIIAFFKNKTGVFDSSVNN